MSVCDVCDGLYVGDHPTGVCQTFDEIGTGILVRCCLHGIQVVRVDESTGPAELTDGIAELEQIGSLLDAGGYGSDRIEIDPSVVRGLGYYTGPVYEAELTFEIFDEKGRKRQFGSVSGGGRYDDLVKRFTGQEVPATGVSIGVEFIHGV